MVAIGRGGAEGFREAMSDFFTFLRGPSQHDEWRNVRILCMVGTLPRRDLTQLRHRLALRDDFVCVWGNTERRDVPLHVNGDEIPTDCEGKAQERLATAVDLFMVTESHMRAAARWHKTSPAQRATDAEFREGMPPVAIVVMREVAAINRTLSDLQRLYAESGIEVSFDRDDTRIELIVVDHRDVSDVHSSLAVDGVLRVSGAMVLAVLLCTIKWCFGVDSRFVSLVVLYRTPFDITTFLQAVRAS